MDGGYVEHGGSWRPFWPVAAVLGALVVLNAGAPVLGAGWSLPKGRTGLPLRRTDGTTVLVPTRAPGELTAALLGAHPAATAEPGTVEP